MPSAVNVTEPCEGRCGSAFPLPPVSYAPTSDKPPSSARRNAITRFLASFVCT